VPSNSEKQTQSNPISKGTLAQGKQGGSFTIDDGSTSLTTGLLFGNKF
jgi:hypothetical protein